MNDLWTHIALFAAISLVIVALGAFYSESTDAGALKSIPRRFAAFLLGCAVLAAIMLLLEHTLASVS